jgi:hypothetical protein
LNLIIDAPASGRWGVREGVKEGDETFWKVSGRKFEDGEEVYPEFRGP